MTSLYYEYSKVYALISALLQKRNEMKKREQQKASTDVDVPPGGVGEEASSAPAAQQHGTRLLRANEVFSDDDSGIELRSATYSGVCVFIL